MTTREAIVRCESRHPIEGVQCGRAEHKGDHNDQIPFAVPWLLPFEDRPPASWGKSWK